MDTFTKSHSQLGRALPKEDILPLELLLDSVSVKTLLNEMCPDPNKKVLQVEFDFVRYHPRVSCIVCCKVLTEDFQNGTTDESIIYIASHIPEHFRQLAGRLETRNWTPGSILPRPLPAPKLNAIFYQFPNDAAIPGLKIMSNHDKIKEILNRAFNRESMPVIVDEFHSLTCRHLRYKPENRFIAHCEFHSGTSPKNQNKRKSIILRFERSHDLKLSFERSLKLYEAFKSNLRICLPKPLACFPDYNLQLFEWVEGEKLSELLRGDEPKKWVQHAAETLSMIHNCQIPDLPQAQPGLESERITHTTKYLSSASEDINRFSQQIAEQLKSFSTARAEIVAGLVHGDFHQGQVLIADRRDYVLDFSRACWGEQAVDLGNFICQLAYWGLLNRLKNVDELEQLFVSDYQQASGKIVPPERLKYWKTIGLLELAMREFRRLKPAWPNTCQMLLRECQKTMNG